MLKRHRWSFKLSAKNPRPVLRLFSSATGPAGIQIPLHQWCTGGYVRACVCVESAWGRVFKEIWDRLLSFTSLLRNDSYSYRWLQSSTTPPKRTRRRGERAKTDFVWTEIWPGWIILDAHRLSKNVHFFHSAYWERSSGTWRAVVIMFITHTHTQNLAGWTARWG